MKRFLLEDPGNEPLTRQIVVRLSERDYNRIKLKAQTYAKGKMSRYIRGAAKFFVPSREHLIEETWKDERE